MDPMTVSQEEWDKLATSAIASEEGAMLAGMILPVAVSRLEDTLKSDPRLLDHVIEILADRIKDGVNTETHGRVMTSLQSLIGLDPTFLLIWLAHSQSDLAEQNERFNVLTQYAPAEMVTFYRILIARFGLELERGLIRFDELADNWTIISREVYYDKLRERYRFKVWIEKFSGEKVLIEGPPDSIILLCANLLSMCSVVEREAYSEERIEVFSQEALAFLAILHPDGDGEENSARAAEDSEPQAG